jgi:hypothetical protein
MPTRRARYSNKQAILPQENRASDPARTWLAALLAVGGVTGLGLLSLPYPFHGDQSLFLFMAGAGLRIQRDRRPSIRDRLLVGFFAHCRSCDA